MNKSNYKVDEEEVKNKVNLYKFTFNMPKIELHAHLTGSLRPKTVIELLKDEKDKEDFYSLIKSKRDIDNCFNTFIYIYKILIDLSVIKRITKEMLEDWSKQNCYYLEIRSNIKATGNSTKYEYLQIVLDEINNFNKENLMQTRFLLSINRGNSLEEALDTLNVFKKFHTDQPELVKLIVGIDFSGLEGSEKASFDDFLPIINEYKKFGLKVSYHIGEIKDYKMVDFSKLVPDRFGHTDYLSQEDIDKIIENNIPYECCPSSSYNRLGHISYKDCNLKNYYKKKNSKGEEYKLYSINTDDYILFNSDLSQEYFEIASAFEMSENDIFEVTLNSCYTIFDDEYKKILIEKISTYGKGLLQI